MRTMKQRMNTELKTLCHYRKEIFNVRLYIYWRKFVSGYSQLMLGLIHFVIFWTLFMAVPSHQHIPLWRLLLILAGAYFFTTHRHLIKTLSIGKHRYYRKQASSIRSNVIKSSLTSQEKTIPRAHWLGED